jgi:hypothetical protein
MKTVFILGAGASHEFGYPLGSELNTQIVQQLGVDTQGKTQFSNLLENSENPSDALGEFRLGLYRSEYDTIDQFLGAHHRKPHLRRIGKQAIAAVIASLENEKTLFRRQDFHWYRRFLDFLRNNPNLAHRNHFTFITFNYDRSLEHYLYEAVTHGGGNFADSVAKDFFENNFIHIHGHVGFLPWQINDSDQARFKREYGHPLRPPHLASIAQNILLPDEDVKLDALLRERLMKANRIIIMGFGFHQQNMKKILFDEIVNQPNIHIDVTVQALNTEKRDLLKKYPAVKTHEFGCADFIGIPFPAMHHESAKTGQHG